MKFAKMKQLFITTIIDLKEINMIFIKHFYNSIIIIIYLQVTIATELGKFVTRMQLERSEVAFFVYTNGSTLR